MSRHLPSLIAAALVIALPFLFRRPPEAGAWRAGDPVVVIITPMNEAIRYEFGRAFAAWHQQQFGRPAKVDWRALGGTTEISRYITAEFINAARAWWRRQGRPWPAGANDAVTARKFARDQSSPELTALYDAFRRTDDPRAFTSGLDLFFGGGEYDHTLLFQQGLTVPPWPPDDAPAGLFQTADGRVLIPAGMSGEKWRTPTMFGCVLASFGICYNRDRLDDLGVARPPAAWDDLADPAYFRQVGAADPTKSGSIAKAFEMIIQQKCRQAVTAAGYDEETIQRYERAIAAAGRPPGEMPPEVPAAYQAAVARGWLDGLRLIQRIGANARYFTDSASKVPIDVSQGDAAAGLVIDFYARYQAQCARAPDGGERMVYLTPAGGSSVSCDPIGLLRGAPHRETAVRFIEFILSEAGQQLWCYRPGEPGGPERFALRRLPIRRDFYPATDPTTQAAFEKHRRHCADDLGAADVNPYELARHFTYQPRWTGSHFNILRDLIRTMCLDSGAELRAAWAAILAGGGPARQPAALAQLERLPDRPEPLTWTSALAIGKEMDRMEYMRAWTDFFRHSYREALNQVRP